MNSPYDEVPFERWPELTKRLVAESPLDTAELIDVVLTTWDAIFRTKIGGKICIGTDYFPIPQILGDFLHELIPYELEMRHPGVWRRDSEPNEKDLVYVPDNFYSAEIKTSSQRSVYGNRSFSKKGQARPAKKEKSGYCIVINFPPIHKLKKVAPISTIRFGWIDIEDWRGQKAETGQQASLPKHIFEAKLIKIYENQKQRSRYR